MKLKIERVTPGMILERNVYLSNSANPLIPIKEGEKHVLSENELTKCIEKGITEIEVEYNPPRVDVINPQALNLLSNALSCGDLASVKTASTFLVKEVVEREDFLYDSSVYMLENRNSVDHAIHTALFVVEFIKKLNKEFGLKIDLYVASQAALLHDIGKNASKEELKKFQIIKFNDSYFPNADKSYFDKYDEKGLPLYSWGKLSTYNNNVSNSNNKISPTAILSVLLQNENASKTGPVHFDLENSNLKQNGIYFIAKAINVCSYLDDLLYEASGSLVEEQIEKDIKSGKIDSLFAKLLCKYIPLYPVGTKVSLSDGTTGTVISTDTAYISRPILKLDENGFGNELDLSKTNAVKIVGLLLPEENVLESGGKVR